ncbi:unnamed protein product, partial [Polarella glacialis]
ENLMEISTKSGADVRRSRELSDNSLVITGDDDSVAAAKDLIMEVIKNEGTTDTVDVSDEVMKALLVAGATKLKAVEKSAGVSLILQKQQLKVSITGAPASIQAAKVELIKIQAEIDKVIAETAVKELAVDYAHIRYIIGPKGAVLNNIREVCAVQVNITDGEETSLVEIRGKPDDVERAVAMIQEIVQNCDKAPDAPQKAAPVAKAVAAKPVAKKE